MMKALLTVWHVAFTISLWGCIAAVFFLVIARAIIRRRERALDRAMQIAARNFERDHPDASFVDRALWRISQREDRGRFS